MTTYCDIAWKITPNLDVEDALSKFAVEYFSARCAVQIDDYQYNIDNGLNDLRAVLKPELELITFCCRYSKDVAETEEMVRAFADNRGIEMIPFTVVR